MTWAMKSFFRLTGNKLFIEDVQVSADASHGKQCFLEKLEQSEEGQTWSVDAEFAEGEILATAEEHGVTLNTPPRRVISHGKFPKTEFVYDAEADTYTCPHGTVLSQRDLPQEGHMCGVPVTGGLYHLQNRSNGHPESP